MGSPRLIRLNSAVSEVMGTILLLMIVVGLFSVVAISVYNLLPFNPAPLVDIVCQVNDDNIILTHRGGDVLGLDTKIGFSNRMETKYIVVGDYLDEKSKEDGKWSVGEEIVYTNSDLLENQIQVMIIDPSSNSFILSTTVQIVDSITITTFDAIDITMNSANLPMHYDLQTQYGSVRFTYRPSDGEWINTSWSSKSGSGSYSIVISSLSPAKLYYFKAQLLYNSTIIQGEQKSFTTFTITNNPPTVTIPYPTNGSTGISVTTTLLSITIQDLEGDPFNWSIVTSPAIGSNNGTAASNGTKTCTITGLANSSTYTWTVKAYDGHHWTNRSYVFETGICPVINTSVNMISPYVISVNPLTITAVGNSDLDNVTLYYRWSDDNSSWDGGGTSGNWYDVHWIYRKKINITGQAGAGTNYQILLNIGEISGVAGANFNLGGHSSNFPGGKNIGGDLRFTNKSGTTSLDFWVDDVSGTAPNRLAKVWVEVKDSLNSSTSIYCYYGNPSASNASNGTNTFNFFDNFDDNSIDASKWTIYQGTWSETGGILRQTSTGAADPKKCIATSAPQSNYYAIRAKVRPDVGTSTDGRAGLSIKTSASNGEGYNYLFHNFVTKTTEQFLDDQVAWGASYTRSAWSFGTWYWFEIYHDGTNVKGRVWNVGGTPGAFNSWTKSGRSGYLALNGGSMGETASFDDVFVRKCIAIEPSYSSAGVEETYIGGRVGYNWIIYTGDTNPDLNSPWSWSFNFPKGLGYYEFYSIGKDVGHCGGDIESAPVSADARCRHI